MNFNMFIIHVIPTSITFSKYRKRKVKKKKKNMLVEDLASSVDVIKKMNYLTVLLYLRKTENGNSFCDEHKSL